MNTEKRSMAMAWLPALAAVGLLVGCASAPRPVPPGNQPIATAQAAGVTLSVPRLDYGEYPGDILDIAVAVLVTIENNSGTDILINPESFTLGAQNDMRYSPIPPQQLAMRTVPAADPLIGSGTGMASFRGGGGGHFGGGGGMHFGGGGVHVAPPTHFGGGGVHVAPPVYGGGIGRVPAPIYRGGWGGPRYYGGYGYGAGYPYWGGGGPYWWWWGPSWSVGFYGDPMWWYGPRYYAWSRADAIRLSLPPGRLPPGGKTMGFLYFPKLNAPEGSQVVLHWQIHEALNQTVIGEVDLPLELHAD
jgi:hypothetical protein